MIINIANRVAEARRAESQAEIGAEEREDEFKALMERYAEAHSRHDNALQALRAGQLDEPTSAARMAVARADMMDLDVLMNAAHQRAEESKQALEAAKQAVCDAEAAFTRRTRQDDFDAIGDQIRRLESKLLGALADYFRLSCELNGKRGSLFGIYVPNPDLLDAVVQMIPPLASHEPKARSTSQNTA
jgi:hypothetical protein